MYRQPFAVLLAVPLAACLQLGTASQDAGAARTSDASSSSDASRDNACTLTGYTCTSSARDVDCYALTARVYDGTLHCLGRLGPIACCAAPSADQTGIPAQMFCASADRTGCVVATLASGEQFALYTPEIWLDPPLGFTACDAAAARDITTVPGCAE